MQLSFLNLYRALGQPAAFNAEARGRHGGVWNVTFAVAWGTAAREATALPASPALDLGPTAE